MQRVFWISSVVCAAAVCVPIVAAPGVSIEEELAPRSLFYPDGVSQPLPGRVVGVLVRVASETAANDETASDSMGFECCESQYRWPYVPATEKNRFTEQDVELKVGERGSEKRVYPLLQWADAAAVCDIWGIRTPFSLVEMEVNDILGAPANETFVATKITQIDGTSSYPIQIVDAVAVAKKRLIQWKATQKDLVDAALTKAGKEASVAQPDLAIAVTTEEMHVGWLPMAERVRIRFLLRTSSQEEQEGFDPDLANMPADGPKLPALERVRWRCQFGVEYGVCYDFNKKGDLVRIQTLAPERFRKILATRQVPDAPMLFPPAPPARFGLRPY